MSDSKAVQEAEQNPSTECEECSWIQFSIGSDEDFLMGKTCNPDAPEECESCQ